MQCMKCGKEIYAGCVFCQECLTEMDKYPIKPGTVVTIPKQPDRKKQAERRPVVTPEQRVKVLTRHVRILSWLLTLTIALLVGVGALTYSLIQETEEGPAIGQNYSYESQPEDDGGASEEADVSRETITKAPE